MCYCPQCPPANPESLTEQTPLCIAEHPHHLDTAENPPPGSELQFHQDLDVLVWFLKYWPTAPSSILASGGPWSGSTPYSAVPSSPLLHAHTSTLERPRHSVYSQPFLKSDGGSTWFSVQCYPLPCSQFCISQKHQGDHPCSRKPQCVPPDSPK